MTVSKVTDGQLVTSIAGRDNGQSYIVVATISPSYVLVADGKKHSMAKPKKKNIRHINVLRSIAQNVAEKLQQGNKPTDEDIRQALALLYAPDK